MSFVKILLGMVVQIPQELPEDYHEGLKYFKQTAVKFLSSLSPFAYQFMSRLHSLVEKIPTYPAQPVHDFEHSLLSIENKAGENEDDEELVALLLKDDLNGDMKDNGEALGKDDMEGDRMEGSGKGDMRKVAVDGKGKDDDEDVELGGEGKNMAKDALEK